MTMDDMFDDEEVEEVEEVEEYEEEEEEEEVEEVEERLIALKSEMEEERQQIIKLEKLIAKGQGAEINVNGNIYRGAVVGLGQVQMPIEHTTCYMKYFQHGGMIETNVIAYS